MNYMTLEDQGRFKKIVELLPEEGVYDFLNLLSGGEKITYEYIAMCSDYDIYSDKILSQFANSKINKEWIIFNASFEALTDFLEEHYSPYPKKDGFFIFYIKHSDKWNRYIEELKKLVKDFKKKYMSFISFAKKELEITDKNPNRKIIKLVGKNGKFSFDRETGGVIFNKFKINFPPEQQKFKVVKIIMTSPDNQGLYKVICQELGFKEGNSSNRKIQFIMRDIKKDLKILPKNKKSMQDIFKPVPRIGYRLVLD